MRPLALITDDRFGDDACIERAILAPAGVELRVAHCSTSPEVAEAGREADALLVNLAPVDSSAIAGLERCRVIARFGVGLDNVDLVAARARGIAVLNVPGYCDREVAEHIIGLILALARHIPERDRLVREGGWDLPAQNRRVAGTVLGILGFGGTAKALIRAALGLGFAEILVWSPHTTQHRVETELGADVRGAASALGLSVASVGFEELLSRADWVSLNLPLLPETRGLIGPKVFKLMKPNAAFINTARGALVDEAALAAALRSGRISGAGLDVLSEEPPSTASPLGSAPNIVFTDHSAYASAESIAELRRRTAVNALEYLVGR